MRSRLLALPSAGVALVVLGVLLFGNLNGNLVYYLTPGEAVARRADFPDGRRFRLAGEVAVGSLQPGPDGVGFTLSDGLTAVAVLHSGAPPQLFQEGIQAVVEGAWQRDHFASDTIIVKHEADYRPPRPVEAAR
ncbi:MAG: cytochrome c maturation protein CcmE [Actinomycetota bacterium]|nr:cytochrome c maturation protein CcmE [Actinomycetota bacterium]